MALATEEQIAKSVVQQSVAMFAKDFMNGEPMASNHGGYRDQMWRRLQQEPKDDFTWLQLEAVSTDLDHDLQTCP